MASQPRDHMLMHRWQGSAPCFRQPGLEARTPAKVHVRLRFEKRWLWDLVRWMRDRVTTCARKRLGKREIVHGLPRNGIVLPDK
ncbi:unnamed protein product [Urochloa humidicola]